jgi:hypothetical protein
MTLLTLVLFGTAFVTAIWTLVASVRPQLHRYRALFAPCPPIAALPLRATRVTVRWAPAQPALRMPLRAAA